jgi:hypothetical protein
MSLRAFVPVILVVPWISLGLAYAQPKPAAPSITVYKTPT